MPKKIEQHFKHLFWVDFPEGGIVTAYQHLSNGVTPRAFQCVGKRNLRSGTLTLVMLELCFELSIEHAVDGQIHGTASPMEGKFATGKPVEVETKTSSTLEIAGLTYQAWRGDPMRFNIPESSHHLTNPAGKRFFADEKKPQ